MLSFFPTPLPDEILCSVFARYHIRSGNRKPKATLLELFNWPNVTVRVDLPYKLASLVENLPLLSKYTVEYLIQKHTMYPMYAVFMPERRKALWRYMKGELGTYVYRGIFCPVPRPKYFKFCPLCFVEDLQKYGEAYWHRLHQTFGIFVCPIHAVALQDSLAPIFGNNWLEQSLASKENCPFSREPISYNLKIFKKLLRLAQDIEWLMSCDLESLPCKELDWFHIQYMTLLAKKGLATVDRWVYKQDLRRRFFSYYTREFLEVLGIDVSEDNLLLFEVLQLFPRVFDPVMHLLMIRFLSHSLLKFWQNDFKYQPFGQGPWLCLNPACEHYLQPVVTKLVMLDQSEGEELYSYIEHPRGIFECDWGFKYSRRGADRTELDKYRFDRIESYGQLWEQQYLKYGEAQRQQFQDTAFKLSYSYDSLTPRNRLRKLEAFWQSLEY